MQAVTMESPGVTMGDEVVHIDPQIWFLRLILLRDQFPGIKELFSYELCSYQSTLFTGDGRPLGV